MNRLYVKIDTKIPITFIFTTMPPSYFLIRATCVYKASQMLGEVVQCCPKHLDEQRQKGVLFPHYFMRASHHDAIYITDSFSYHHSVLLSCSQVQAHNNTLTLIYTMPCYTSELPKGGQLVQVLFTLESAEVAVVGRCVMDLKVCASPGRARANDEVKDKAAAGVDSCSDANPRKRKRVSSEVITASSVSGSKALTSAERRTHTITTFPELFPYVDSMVSMLEAVYKVRITGPTTPETESQSSILSHSTSLSQATSATAAAGQAVELLQIQVKKTICNKS